MHKSRKLSLDHFAGVDGSLHVTLPETKKLQFLKNKTSVTCIGSGEALSIGIINL